MTITQILSNEDTTSTEKLTAISEIVAKVRETYGNTDAEITVPDTVTIDGLEPLSMLSDDSKLALVERVVKAITTDAYEDSQTEGVVLDKRIEEYIAINPILTNLDATLGSAYI